MTYTIKKRRAISPLLATVILLGITVAGGGAVFGFYSTTQDVLASAGDPILIQGINALATSNHGSLSFIVTNIGDKPWTGVAINAIKGDVPARIFYMPLEDMGETFLGSNPSSAVTPSAVTDLIPGDNNGGLVGYSNLISYSTPETAFAPFQIFTTGTGFYQPSTLCTDNPLDVAANFIGSAICAGTTTYTGIQLDDVINQGDSINPSSFLFTELPPNVTLTARNQIDTVQAGDEITLQVIVDFADGTEATKTTTFTVR